jgi:hypothetical protein
MKFVDIKLSKIVIVLFPFLQEILKLLKKPFLGHQHSFKMLQNRGFKNISKVGNLRIPDF